MSSILVALMALQACGGGGDGAEADSVPITSAASTPDTGRDVNVLLSSAAASPPAPTEVTGSAGSSDTAQAASSDVVAEALLGEFPSGASTCAPMPADWLDLMPTHQKRIEPADCGLAGSTPLFAWGDARDRMAGSAQGLAVRIAGGPVIATVAPLSEPLASLPQPLAAGSYEWTAQFTNQAGANMSTRWRRFRVEATVPSGADGGQAMAAGSALPSGASFAVGVQGRARPRMLPAGSSYGSLRSHALQPENLPVLNLLRSRAARAMTLALPGNPDAGGNPVGTANLDQVQNNRNLVQIARAERFNIEYLALIGRLDANAAMLAQAKARVLGLAGWSPTGVSSESSADQAHREIFLALAEGLDLLWDEFTTTDRDLVARSLRERLLQTSQSLALLVREPYDSHSLTNLRYIIQALMLAVGTPGIPEAPSLLARFWDLGRHSVGLWGRDGSFGNGIAYGWYHLTSLTPYAAAVRGVAGVDLYQLPAFRDAGRQLIAMTAPNWQQPSSFGDESETRNLYELYSAGFYRLHAQMSRQPEDAWYWQAKPANVAAPNDAGIWQILLLGADARPQPRAAAPSQNDWFSTDSGLAAMHTDIGAAARTSVFFRSSRFGAYNHSHADQNSLVYVSRGQPLLINAGYYPYYNSPHHRNIRATRFKNALTYDGGFGQSEVQPVGARPSDPFHSMDAAGALIRAQTQGSLSVVTGDATAAYRAVDSNRGSWLPGLTNVVRSVVFDKAHGLTLVYDWASSETPRQWELNFHSPAPFLVEGDTVKASAGDASVCLDRHGPAMNFSQTQAWEVMPETTLPAQSHGRYAARARSHEFVHLTVLRDGCRDTQVQVGRSGTQVTVTIAGRAPLRFDKRALDLAQ